VFIVRLSITVTKYLRQDLLWLTVSEVSVHHGKKGMVELSSSHNGSQEAGRKRKPVLVGLLPFSLLFHLPVG
jgi:hypothetical protein